MTTEDKLDRAERALRAIRDSIFCSYDHPHCDSEMYRGSYGIGVVDGHRACANMARDGLGEERAS